VVSIASQPRPGIAITGFGAVTALGPTAEGTFAALLAGRSGIRPIRGFDTTGCRVAIGAEVLEPDPLPPGRRAREFRTAALALRAARAALAAAGVGPSAEPLHDSTRAEALVERGPAGTALSLGTTGSGDAILEGALQRVRPGGRVTALVRLARYPKRSVAEFLARELALGGPLATINTACSSGAVAIAHGADLLRAGLCDRVLAGGADELTRYTLTGFSALRAVDPAPCRPFDRARRGLSLGEGAGFLVLERADDAVARGAEVLGWVLGCGLACDAGHLTAPDADGAGATRAIQAALADAGTLPSEIGFVNAHGTGTPHNDRAEVEALVRALGTHASRCPVHSVKASVGHCLGAAGAIEAVLTLASLRAGWIPHTAGLEHPEHPDRLDFVRGEPRSTLARVARSTSFGFGGNDAALVLAAPEVSPCTR
jgi:3-oxoacyl-[acyl-carrier-protein] synthase II